MSPSFKVISHIVLMLPLVVLAGIAHAQGVGTDTTEKTYNYSVKNDDLARQYQEKVAELDAAIKAQSEALIVVYQKKIDIFSSGDCSQSTMKRLRKEDSDVGSFQGEDPSFLAGVADNYNYARAPNIRPDHGKALLAERQALSPEYAQAMQLKEEINVALRECFDNTPAHKKYLEAVDVNKVVKRLELAMNGAAKMMETLNDAPIYCYKALPAYYMGKAALRTPVKEFQQYAAHPKVIAVMRHAVSDMAAAEAAMAKSSCADKINNEEGINERVSLLNDKDNGIKRPRSGRRGRGAAQPAVEDSSIEEDVEETEPATDTQ